MPKSSLAIDYDPFSAAAISDPFPAYQHLRDHAPLYWIERRQMWAISRYDDVIQVTRDWETFSNAQGADSDDLGGLFPDPGNFLDEDPPLHDQLRRVLHARWTPKSLRAELESKVRAAAESIVAGLGDRADLSQELGWPIPVTAVSTLLGFPEEDWPLVRKWGEDVTRRTPGQMAPPPRAQEAVRLIREYVADQLERRRAQPRPDLLSLISNAELGERRLGESGIGMATLLMVAGLETTASLITNALYLLATHPEQRDWLREHPEAILAAVEEVLRYEAPVQHLRRVTTRTTDLCGTELEPGSVVLVLYGSANRDPRKFVDAEIFDIRREPQRHLAFGNGIHHCLGAPLARLEAGIVLEVLLARAPHYELDGAIRRFPSHMDRGLESLPVRLGPLAAAPPT